MAGRWKRIGIWLGAAMGVVLLIGVAAVAFLAGTPTGARWVLRLVAPAELELGAVRGRLAGTLRLDDVHYTSPGLTVEIARVELDWRPRRLLGRVVEIRSLTAAEVRVTVLEVEQDAPPREPGPLPDFRLPIRVEAHQVSATDVTIRTPDTELPLFEVSLAAAMEGPDLALQRLVIRGDGFEATANGELSTAGAYPVRLALEWSVSPPDRPALAGAGTADGRIGALRLEHRLVQPVAATARAEVHGLPAPPQWTAELSVPRFLLDALGPDLPAHAVTLSASARGEDGRAEAHLTAAAELDGIGELAAQLEAGFEPGRFAIRSLEAGGRANDIPVALSGSGEIDLAAQHADLLLDWTASPPDLPRLRGRARLSGDRATALLEHTLSLPVHATLSARVDDPAGDPRWTAALDVPAFDVAALTPDAGDARLSLRATASGDLQRFTAHGASSAWLGDQTEPDGSAELQVGADLATRRLDLTDLAVRLAGGGALSARGHLDFQDDVPAFALRGEWRDLSWPPAPDPGENGLIVTSPAGAFRASGSTAAFAAELEGRIRAGEELPGADVRLAGRGSAAGFALDSLTAETPAGALAARGRIDWEHGIAWDLSVEADALELAALAEGLAGRLSLDATSQGEWTERGPRAELDVRRLTYEHDDRHLQAAALAAVDGDTIVLRSLVAEAGETRLEASGRLDDAWAMAWSLDSPSLDAVSAELAGRLTAAGRVTGPRARPRIVADLDGDALAFRDFAAGSVFARFDLDLTDSEASRLELAVEDVRAGTSFHGGVRARGDGRLADHVLSVDLWSQQGDTVALELAGALELPAEAPVATHDPQGLRLAGSTGAPPDPSPGWAGRVTALRVSSRAAGELILREPAALTLTGASALLGRMCLTGEHGSACIDGEWDRETGGRASLEASDLDVAAFAGALPPGLEIDGPASASANLRVSPEGKASGRLDARAGPGRLAYHSAARQEEVRGYRTAVIRADLGEDGALDGTVSVELDDGTGLTGEVRLAGGRDPAERPLEGRFTADLRDRGLLGASLIGLGETDGILLAHLTLGGTLASPEVTGRIDIEEGVVEIPDAGIRVVDIGIQAADAGGGEWRFEASGRSGNGEIGVTGRALLPRPGEDWSLTARATGQDFEAARLPIAHVIVAPELELSARPGRADLTGEVRVPFAEITPRDMSGAVAASPDVILVDDIGAEAVPTGARDQPVALHTRVRVTLGDSVRFDGHGLTGRIAGSVVVVDEPGRLTTGRGELQILDGEYTAFRQRLSVERGRLVFTDTPVEDPGLDLRVTRQTREVLAGLNVRGTLSEPEVTIFSEPAMAETEALAYLLIGRPLRGAGEAEGELVQRMAASLGLAGGGILAGRLGQTLGLVEARIERGDELSEAALVLGTYLSPRLYIGYGLGLFDDGVTAIRLRYQLAQRWVIRTESGREIGADLLYSVER